MKLTKQELKILMNRCNVPLVTIKNYANALGHDHKDYRITSDLYEKLEKEREGCL